MACVCDTCDLDVRGGAPGPTVSPLQLPYAADSICTAADDNGDVITHQVGSGNCAEDKFTDY